MILTRGRKYEINQIDTTISEIVVEVRTQIKLNEKIDLNNYIIDAGVVLTTGNTVDDKSKLIYFENPTYTVDDYNVVEFLKESDMIRLDAPLNDFIDKASKTYHSKSQQIKVYLHDLPQDIDGIKIIVGLYNCENTNAKLDKLSNFTVRLINAGITRPEEIVRYSEKNYFDIEQSAMLCHISRLRDKFTFNAEAIGTIGNLIDIYNTFKPNNINIEMA